MIFNGIPPFFATVNLREFLILTFHRIWGDVSDNHIAQYYINGGINAV